MKIEALIDRFVDHVNGTDREAMVKPIAPSFIDFVTAILNGSPRG